MDSPGLRRQQLTRFLADEELDALLVSSPVNVTYLTGFTGDSSHLVLTRNRAILISDHRFTVQIAEECPGLETYFRPPVRKLPEAIAEVLDKLGVRAIGFESSALTVAEFETLRDLLPEASWKGGADRVERLRMVKDEGELAAIRDAIDVAERAFTVFRALLVRTTRKKTCATPWKVTCAGRAGRRPAFPPSRRWGNGPPCRMPRRRIGASVPVSCC
jgi:Xaa-Pro aminopeptidase